MRVAVIGSGISGSLAARLLSTRHDVTLFEANDYVGGHANTVDVRFQGRNYAIDTGFMVFNRRTYPNFCRMLQLLNVPSRESDMSFSVRCASTGWEYQGSSLNGLFAQRWNALRPSFLRMLRDIVRFNRQGLAAADSGALKDGRSVREFLRSCGVGKRFTEQYLVPMAAAIWSSRPQTILDFPADFLVGFFANHGLLQLRDRPQWRTISGGSRNYLKKLLEPIRDRVRLSCPINCVERTDHAVRITPVDEMTETFDEVVFACHAPQALKLLADATPLERQILRAFPYQANQAVLHTDCRLLPRRRRAWASWNYHLPRSEQRSASVTYDLSRLQGLDSPTPILLTLNATDDVDPNKVLRTFTYDHPSYSRDSIVAQRRFEEISGLPETRTHFCGAYWGYGFHEDGVNSALAVARRFGIELEACTVASTKALSRTAAVAR